VTAVERIHLSHGLVGFPDLTTFKVRPVEGPLVELVAEEAAEFGLLALPLETVQPLARRRLEDLGQVGREEAVLVFLSLHGDPPQVTANLAGPLVVAPGGAARQLVVEDPAFPLRLPLGPLAGAPTCSS
jgi:flagellar assembly factor FliW